MRPQAKKRLNERLLVEARKQSQALRVKQDAEKSGMEATRQKAVRIHALIPQVRLCICILPHPTPPRPIPPHVDVKGWGEGGGPSCMLPIMPAGWACGGPGM